MAVEMTRPAVIADRAARTLNRVLKQIERPWNFPGPFLLV